jgi:hypothetical protein
MPRGPSASKGTRASVKGKRRRREREETYETAKNTTTFEEYPARFYW